MQTAKLTEVNLKHYKPVAKSLTVLGDAPTVPGTVYMCKADGEFTVIHYNESGCTASNLWGTVRSDFHALRDLQECLKAQGVKSAIILSELFGIRDGVMMQLPEFEHIIKSGSTEEVNELVYLGVFDLVQLNGKHINDTYEWKLAELSSWLTKPESHAILLPHITLTEKEKIREREVEVADFWKTHVEAGPKYEGLFARSNGDSYKIKPKLEVDAVIVGINKQTKRFKFNEVTSFKIALMDHAGGFILLGDCSGLDQVHKKKLWALVENFKVDEDQETVWVKPIVVVKVEFTSTFLRDTPRLEFKGDRYEESWSQPFYSMRHPRFVCVRADKEPRYEDVRMEQLAVRGLN